MTMTKERAMLARRVGVIVTATGLFVGGGLWLHNRAEARDRPAYRFVAVERGDLEVEVSATGALAAVRTVQVGTQVSGQLAEIHVDFNDRVRKGQLLARIDPTLARQAVADAQASLDRVMAEQVAAQQELQRNQLLVNEGLLAPSAFEPMQTRLAVAKANVSSARVAVQRARQNLTYTEIRSPIDGVVVERNVDVGQTVAASLAAPQLFLIANDLRRMQIVVSVDESDIASIAEGQPVRFTVQARPRERFTGRVEQVRLQSTTLENIVSYGVVVSVENPEMKLLPGMTARVEFQVDSATDVLKVANAALRFRPEGTPAPSAAAGRGSRERPASQVWTLQKGALKAVRVRAGLSDGVMTEIDGAGLEPGTQVIAGMQVAEAATPAANPLQPRTGGGAGRRPGGGF
jgi:HlyD family secretion protein